MDKTMRTAYYALKPLIPRKFQLFLRRKDIALKRKRYTNNWPIQAGSGSLPENWSGWPGNKKFALVLTHDVDTDKGQKKCHLLMKMEKDLGFRSLFNFVPERYSVSTAIRNLLTNNGFEVGVHGLYHDGRLFQSETIFRERSKKINMYLEQWDAVGFRAPAMHHNLDWLHLLNIKYDASTFDTDPFEPQSDGVGTIFPFRVWNRKTNTEYIELPYTLPQDFTLFILMREKTIDIWKRKLDWIIANGGMALLNTHPDYMYFGNGKRESENYPASFYYDFLDYIKKNFEEIMWHVLPKDLCTQYSYSGPLFCESHRTYSQ